jgi:uncharacterized membrane protein
MNNKFDELGRNLAQLVTRRQAMRKAGLALGLVLGTVTINLACGATFMSIDFPNALVTEVNGIAPSGPLVIVGDYADAITEHGYMLSNGTFTAIDFPGALVTQAFGINVDGVVVGDYCVATGSGTGSSQHGYFLNGGTFTSIDFPGAAFTTARGINLQGDIVGTYFTSSGNSDLHYLPPANTGHGFVLSAGTYTSIDFPGATLTEAWRITDEGQVLGRYKSSSDGKYHLFLFEGGVFTSVPDVPGGSETAPADVSFGALDGNGNIVGDYADQTPIMEKFRLGKANGNLHGFLLSGGVYTTIDFPGAMGTAAWGVHSSGVVVGPYLDTNDLIHGYLRMP